MFSYKIKKTFLKFFSLFSIVRGHNIIVLILAQYLAAIFIFSPKKSVKEVLLDTHLLYIILASICVISAGYIINSFYDVKVDRINRPLKTGLDNYVKQSFRLKLYFAFNFLGFSFGFLISWRAALFFALYIFGIWFYSHKLKKHPLIGLISVTILTILPFFAVFIYFKNFSKIIFVHAVFLFLVLLVRELLKDLQNMKGAIAHNYDTFPIVYGEKNTKLLSLFLLLLTLFPITILWSNPALGYMKYYFYFSLLMLLFVGFYLWKSTKTKQYRMLHNLLKVILLIGVISLVFIDTSLIVEKVIDRLN